MGLKIEFPPEARVELIEAVEWYEAQQNSLGFNFLITFEKPGTSLPSIPGFIEKPIDTFERL